MVNENVKFISTIISEMIQKREEITNKRDELESLIDSFEKARNKLGEVLNDTFNIEFEPSGHIEEELDSIRSSFENIDREIYDIATSIDTISCELKLGERQYG